MLVACRLAGLSALEGHYAGVRVVTQFGPTQRSQGIEGKADICADELSGGAGPIRLGRADFSQI